MKKNLKIILIIVAALIVLAIAGVIILKDGVKSRPPVMPNVTLLKCHLFMDDVTESDLNGIKEVIVEAIGDKVLGIDIGDIPLGNTRFLVDENDEDVNVGDPITVTLSILDSEQKTKMITTLLQAYKIEIRYWNDIYEIKDIYSSEYK